MRSKIEANEYKDYILGFIFYKYLSDQLVRFAQQEGMTDADIATLREDDTETKHYFQKSLGYFMAYDHLFSTWLTADNNFDVSQVRDGLAAFERLIHDHHKKLFNGIFNTLQTGLSKLGESPAKQTKAVRDLLHLIKDIPMDGKRGYDVLGYIYEYLIEKFAANAGKKAGEFYTPHEVSLLMSEIVAHHLKDRQQIQIYDPTSGSGSLLINIGSSVAKYLDNTNNIKYYAQELKANTYNLTRMNLVMRGMLPSNIVTRNGDTLEEDWPYFEENDPIGSYNPLYVDAVVSNPPYSQNWDSTDKKSDPRYSRFGLAPKTKADYAFLLHDLYHLKPDGIMTIVLPHGVLFRGGEEGQIRKNLIEQNHIDAIDAIIGLPANIFFGTGIPTVILVLRQKRENTDILIVDGSKHFIKEGKNNRLQASDIKRIADRVIQRQGVAKFSRVVSKAKIRENDYNLNIPRYVDSAEDGESWDLHALMLGGIPQKEINQLGAYWQAFPQLRETLFTAGDYAQLCLKSDLLKDHITQHPEVQGFSESYQQAFGDFEDFLYQQLIENWQGVNRNQQEAILSEDLFVRLGSIPLIDKYLAYQLLNNHWQVIGTDLEILQTEGFAASKQVDPNLVIKKKDGKDTEVQEGWKGHVLPFELVQGVYLSEQLQALRHKEARLAEISAEFEEIIDSFTEEEKGSAILNDKNDAFNKSETNKALEEIYADIETEEILILRKYLALLDGKAKKPDKIAFIEANPQVKWRNIIISKDGTYAKGNVNKYLQEIQSVFTYREDSYEGKIVRANSLLNEESELKKTVKRLAEDLHLKTKAVIEELTDAQVLELLALKWIRPLFTELMSLPDGVINRLTAQVQALADKYAVTYGDVAQDIQQTEQCLAGLLDELTGSEADMQCLAELKLMLGDF